MAQKKITRAMATKYARDYVNHIRRKYRLPVQAAYLFGSFASGQTRAWSDIDVCVISPKFKQLDPLEYLWLKRRDIDVDRGVEPYGLAPEDFVEINPIANEVKQHGVLLYQARS